MLERNKAAAPPQKGRHSRFNFTVYLAGLVLNEQRTGNDYEQDKEYQDRTC